MIKKYVKIFNTSISTSFIYKENYFINVFMKALVVILNLFLWTAVFKGNNLVGGYNSNTIIIYILGINLIFELTNSEDIAYSISDEILNGKLSSHLLRPYSYFLATFCEFLGKKISTIPAYGSIYFIIFLVWIKIFSIDVTWLNNVSMNAVFYILLFSAIGLVLNFIIDFILGILAFNIENPWVVYFVKGEIVSLLSGTVIPLDIFPAALQKIFKWLPFQYSGYFQSSILLKSGASINIEGNLIRAILLTLLFLIIASVLWKEMINKYKSVGG